MKGWDDGSRDPLEESLARVRAGRNELYTTVQKGVVVDPTELVEAMTRFVRQIVDEALTARGIR